ncbi:uncharacterized protein LOC131685855 [Topomyia yanbarensis]|uniref:uncharacterized protein LOC131685855 n=1 Tax=Topomyia yanbarensis TaxID=2498891 RepID=UPI00273BD1EC|nr:uncharacterized protein LOC131685855 [Topomyia yanbarensis]
MKFYLLGLLGCFVFKNLVTCQHDHHSHQHHHHRPDHHHHHHHHHPDGYHHGWSWHNHHHGHHGRHHWPHHLNFEIREPKGLECSMIQMVPSQTFFSIELYINQDPRENETQCDVCRNTTDVTYKKFIIEDEDVVIRKGDLLSYYVYSGNESNAIRHQLQQIWVTDSIIKKCNCDVATETPDIDVRIAEKPSDRPSFDNNPFQSRPSVPSVQPPKDGVTTEDPFDFDEIEKSHQNDLSSSEEKRFECDLDPATNLCRTAKTGSKKSIPTSQDLQQELQILRGIIIQMKDGCTARRSSNNLLLKQAPIQANGIEQLTSFVRSALAVCPELEELGNGIHRVIPVGPAIGRGVIFEMSNYVDKQKVLYHARLHKLEQVVDYDVASKGY